MIEFNVSNLAIGTYFIDLITEGSRRTAKFVVVR